MILVDSDVLIAHLRGSENAQGWLLDARRKTGQLATSVVTVTEITGGMRTTERREVTRLLSSLRLEPVGDRIALRAGELMRQFHRSHSGIGLGDYLVAATAKVRGLELATLNIRHYPMFEGLVPPFRA